MDQQVYEDTLWAVARVHSARDLDQGGRTALIRHFNQLGWRSSTADKFARPRRQGRLGLPGRVTDLQLELIRGIWARLHQAAVVHSGDEGALRAWVNTTTRRYHPLSVGYDALEFLPGDVAGRVIEHLKQWAKRCEVVWR